VSRDVGFERATRIAQSTEQPKTPRRAVKIVGWKWNRQQFEATLRPPFRAGKKYGPALALAVHGTDMELAVTPT